MKRKAVLLTTFALVALLIAGGTMAWFTDDADATNTFKTGRLEINVKEEGFNEDNAENVEPGKCYDKVVKIENTGTLDAYVRVKLEPKWEGTQEDAKAYYMVKNKVYKIIGIPSDHVIPQGGSEIVCPVSGLLKWICGLFGCDHKPKDPPKPNDPAKWFYNHDDDYYYYTKVLEAGKGDDSITKSLIDKVCFEGSLGN